MVKVKGPMFSMDASGTFAKACVFQHNMYGVYVRRKEIKRKTNTFAQVVQNAEFSQAIEDWNRSLYSVKEIFRNSTKVFALTGYSSFLKQWFCLRNNAVYGYARYGQTVFGLVENTIPKKDIY